MLLTQANVCASESSFTFQHLLKKQECCISTLHAWQEAPVPDVWAYQFRVLFANAEHKSVSGTAPPWLARMSQLDDTQHTKHVQTVVSMIVQQVLHSRH